MRCIFNPYTIKSVLSVHAQMVLEFLQGHDKEKNNIKILLASFIIKFFFVFVERLLLVTSISNNDVNQVSHVPTDLYTV